MTTARSQSGFGALALRYGLPLLVIVAGVGIAAVFWRGNKGSGGVEGSASCPARPAVAKALKAAATGPFASLVIPARGHDFADLSFATDKGEPVSLSDFAGTPLLVNFWATWCIPCRKEMPELDQLAVAYDHDTFQVVTINLNTGPDGANKAHAFLDDEGLGNLPVYTDPTGKAFERLKTEGVALGLPATLLVDKNGCEMASFQGGAAWNGAEGHKLIDSLIRATGGKDAG